MNILNKRLHFNFSKHSNEQEKTKSNKRSNNLIEKYVTTNKLKNISLEDKKNKDHKLTQK